MTLNGSGFVENEREFTIMISLPLIRFKVGPGRIIPIYTRFGLTYLLKWSLNICGGVYIEQ